MRAGELRHLITIEQAVEAQDGHGQPIETWETFAQVYGSVEPLTGRERFLSNELIGEISARAKIRYLAGVTEKMRINYGGKYYYIAAPPIDKKLRHAELELHLSEGLIGA